MTATASASRATPRRRRVAGARRGGSHTAARALVGVDVGGTKIQVLVTDGVFRQLGRSRAPTPTSGGPPAVTAAIRDLILAALGDAGRRSPSAIGIGTPGVIDRATGVVARSPNLAGWMEPYPLGSELGRHFGGAPVVIDNDVRAGTLGEHRLGAGRGHDDLLGVWFGTGVGGALILGGRLRSGRIGACGEIGHMVARPRGRRCGCGRRGCLEAYAGRASMERRARKLVHRGRSTDLFKLMERSQRPRVTSGVIARALERGDALTHRLLDEAVAAAGCVVASACNLVDVEVVVIGGGLGSRLGAPFVQRVAAAMQPHLFVDGDAAVRVVGAELGDDAGALGAATEAAELL